MGILLALKIKTTPEYKVNSTYHRVKDMGEGIKKKYDNLKKNYSKFNRKLNPIEQKVIQLLAIKQTLETKESLRSIKEKIKTDFRFLSDIHRQISNGISLSNEQVQLITEKFISINSKLKDINLQEAIKEQIDTTAKLKIAFRQLEFNKIEFKLVKKSTTTIIRAKKQDNTTVSVRIEPNGSFEIDLSNVPKERCKTEMNKIIDKFKEHGFELEVQKIYEHKSLSGADTTREIEEYFNPFNLESNFEMTELGFESVEDTNSLEQNRINQLNLNKQRR